MAALNSSGLIQGPRSVYTHSLAAAQLTHPSLPSALRAPDSAQRPPLYRDRSPPALCPGQSGKLRHSWKPLLLQGAQRRAGRPGLGSAQKPSEGSPLHAGPQMTGLETTCLRNSEPRASRGPQGPAYIPSPSPKASSHHSPRVPALTLAGSAALPSMDSLSPQFHPVLWVWHVIPRPGPALSWLPAHCNTFPRDPRPPHSCP